MGLFLVALAIVVADQFSKAWISANLLIGQLIPETGFFRITLVHNSGAAFGLFYGYSFPLSIVAIIGIVVLLFYVLFLQRRFPALDRKRNNLALGLILGGIIGNLIDRLRQGYVTDFISVGIWPPFNVADSAVVVGTIIFAYSLYFAGRASAKKESEANRQP